MAVKSLFVVFFSFLLTFISAQDRPLRSYEGYFLYQGKHPRGLEAKDWFPDNHEVQGVTNDGKNWFFTIVDAPNFGGTLDHALLWRIPKKVDLNGNVATEPGVQSINYLAVKELRDEGFVHWGDPDHFKYKNRDYILVPVYGDKSSRRSIACFSASPLEYINFALLDGKVDAGWCAVGRDSMLYSSKHTTSTVTRYKVNWDLLTTVGGAKNSLTFDTTIQLYSENEDELLMTDMQGGEFSNSGEILFLVSGRGECFIGAEWTPRDGIHAVRTDNWKRINQSVKRSESKDYFSYDYDPTCDNCVGLFDPGIGTGTHTPEGLTVWKLDDINRVFDNPDDFAPHILGSLHVLVDYYLIGDGSCNDEFDFYHYSGNVVVMPSGSSFGGLKGTVYDPFSTIEEALDYYPIWDGAELLLETGNYDEKLIINDRIRITSFRGPAIIGRK